MRRLILPLLVVWFALCAGAQSLSYSLLASNSPGPSARLDGAIAYDPGGKRVLLFGGQDNAPRNDLWEYSLDQSRWLEIKAAGTPPPARFGHTVVFDAARRRLIVFGGQAGGFFSDVWAFDMVSGAWRQLSPDDAGPARRYGHSAIADTRRDRMVVSHGFTSSGRFDDTWAFDFASNSWRDLSPAGTRPLRRCLHHAAYDAGNDQMYLYGGCSSGFGPCPQGDLWSFDLAQQRWTERTPRNSPPPREHYGMAYDGARGKLVVFGGYGSGLLNDTWEFDGRAGLWEQPAISGPPPAGRQRHEALYAADTGAVLFFGGLTAAGSTNELWVLNGAARPVVSAGAMVNAFSGEGGSVAPGEAVSLYGTGLGPLVGVAFGFDAVTGRLPTSGAGVAVTWNGVPAPLYFVRADQVNVQVPYEVAGAAEAVVVVTVNGQASETAKIPLSATRPGLFPRVWNQDGTINSPDNPATAGSAIVLYATGQGITNPASPSGAFPVAGVYPVPAAAVALRVGGIGASVLFRGQAPGTAGVMQINANVPETHGAAVPVVLSVGGRDAQNGVKVAVR